MNEVRLNDAYFEWMCKCIRGGHETEIQSHQKLLQHLNEVEFTYILPMDGNRAEDGVDLRYHFGYEQGIANAIVASYLDNRPCSVLEMMVALATRCEEQIMTDPEIGNRTGKWFWDMVCSLGLITMTDQNYTDAFVDRVINRFLMRMYDADGRGGLFAIRDSRVDMREEEIWHQMMDYLNAIA